MEREQDNIEPQAEPRGIFGGITNIIENIRDRLNPGRKKVTVVLGDQTPVGFPEKFAETMGKLYPPTPQPTVGFPEKFAAQMARFSKQVDTEETA